MPDTPVILFVSDCHLDASRPKVAEAFFRFLRGDAVNAEALYILGDLFELWIGDDDDDPFVDTVQQHLKQLSGETPVFFMHGNRDFLIGDAFAVNSGATLLPDPTILRLGDETVVLMHGDSLCTKDQAYQAFRAQSRSREWVTTVLAKSLAERRALGQQLRQQSKTMSSRKAVDIMDVSAEAVAAVILEHQADKLIHGHTHRPRRHPLQVQERGMEKKVERTVERIVLGDWDEQAWCLRYDGDWHLDSWEIN